MTGVQTCALPIYDDDFGSIYEHCLAKGYMDKFYLFDGFLFRIDKVCIPHCSLRSCLLRSLMTAP